MRNLRVDVMSMVIAGTLLLLSGSLHLAAWLILGGTWEGDTSLRKPILFGISAGATMLSMAWVANQVNRRRGDRLWFAAFSFAMVFEVGLITIQQWRGVASHFNRSTPLDAAILAVIETFIVFATVVIVDLTWRSFRCVIMPRDIRWAIRSGMSFLVLGCVFGFIAVGYGNYQLSIREAPGTYGQSGVMKFPHGMPLHAIQFIPMMAWVLAKQGLVESERLRAVWYSSLSLATLTLFSCLQTFRGRSRFDVDFLSGAVLAICLGLLIPPAWSIWRNIRRRFRQITVTTAS